jgi:hypothetical protein
VTPAASVIRKWRLDPVSFVWDNFQVTPDEWQRDVLLSLKPQGVNRICMKACAGPGKSAVLAWLGWWFLTCMADEGQHPKGIAVSITADNLARNLWPELAKWQSRSPYLSAAFTHNSERIYANDHPDTWRLDFGSFAKTANAQEQGSTLSGLHSEFAFVLGDESGGLSPAIGRAAEQAMGGVRCGMIAQAGNPISLEGWLYESAMTNRGKWTVVEITADPEDPKRTPRVSKEWAQEMIDKWGRGNPWCMAYVLGKFPPSSINTLLGAEEVTAALGRIVKPDAYSFAPKVVSADVARFGDDRTVIWKRQGLAAFQPDIMRNARSEDIAGRVAERASGWADGILIDGTGGYGAGAVDALRLANWDPIEVQFSGAPSDPRFFNKRAEIWWKLAEWVKGGGCLPNVPELVRELTAPTYWMQNGKLRLEEKDQIKERLGESPDLADGLAVGFAVDIMPKKLQHVVTARPSVIIAGGDRQSYSPFRRR